MKSEILIKSELAELKDASLKTRELMKDSDSQFVFDIHYQNLIKIVSTIRAYNSILEVEEESDF